MKKTVNILGQEYKIKEVNEQDHKKLTALNADGLAELYSKEIIINKTILNSSENSFSNLEEYKKQVLRHEIVHCFFHESGLKDECRDEKLVEWLAIQIPKIVKAMKKVDCLE